VNATDVFILNVGAGACAVIDHPGPRISMVDINNGGKLRAYEREAMGDGQALAALLEAARYEAKLVNPIDWYKERFGTSLWRFILSHPDADHMAGVRHLLRGEINVSFFWDLEHDRVLGAPEDYSNAEAFDDALAYFAFRWQMPQHRLITWPHRLCPARFAWAHYWMDDQIEILSPSQLLIDGCHGSDKWNNASYALRINHAGRSVLLPGDIEEKAWGDIANACVNANVPLQTDVLVASHHGRKSGYPGDFIMKLLNPETVIVSTAKLNPNEDGLPIYRARVDDVYSTRTYGSLLIRLWDDGAISVCNGVDSIFDTPTEIKSTWPRRTVA
jgi:competence protein ComEC